MRQLFELSRKFPKEWIKKAPKGKFGNYVPHPVITQRLLEVCGPFNWEVVELIRQESSGSVVGCFGKLTVEIDGKPVTVTSIGDVEHDQKNDGSNAKHAESDAFKRCAMKLGLGLHLWAGDEYYLDKQLEKKRQEKKINLQSASELNLPSFELKTKVLGPSFISPTCIIDPKLPSLVITFSDNFLYTFSNISSAILGSLALIKEGLFPFKKLPASVNWLTSKISPSTSIIDLFIFKFSSENILKFKILLIKTKLSESLSPCSIPQSKSSPWSISEILFPSTSTYAFFTLCKTTFINYNLTHDTRQ